MITFLSSILAPAHMPTAPEYRSVRGIGCHTWCHTPSVPHLVPALPQKPHTWVLTPLLDPRGIEEHQKTSRTKPSAAETTCKVVSSIESQDVFEGNLLGCLKLKATKSSAQTQGNQQHYKTLVKHDSCVVNDHVRLFCK